MFVNKLFTHLTWAYLRKKRCLNVKSSTYYFHVKTKVLADFQTCISVPLRYRYFFYFSYFHVALFCVALFLCCIFSILHSFHVLLFPCYCFSMLHYFHAAIFVLHSFHVALSSYSTLFILHCHVRIFIE